MNFDKNALARMRALCLEIGPDDGLDKRELNRLSKHQPKEDRAQQRLAGLARRVLDLALASSPDPVLQTIVVARISPEPGRLRVWVHATDPQVEPALALARLRGAAGWLRSELSQAVQRKRSVDLVFDWAVSDEVRP